MKLGIALLVFAVCVAQDVIVPWTCTSYELSLTVGTEMTPVTCTCTTTVNGRIAPTLPAGLKYTVVSGDDNLKTITISGTPAVGLQKTVYSIGYNRYVSSFSLEVFGTPTELSYGFKSMVIFVGVALEPIPPTTNSAITSFTSNPTLPTGMTIDSVTGVISGSVSSTSDSGQEYTITATNSRGSITTVISFTIRENQEMTLTGFVACYYAGITECLVPSLNYFYKNSAQYCQQEAKVDFSDTWASETGSVWPGLDYRFLDYYSAYMYGYINVLVAGTYTFYLKSDDGALLSIDDLSTVFIDRDSCRGSSTTSGTKTLTVGRHLFAIRFFEFNEAAVLKLEYECSDVGISRTVVDSNVARVGGRGPTFISYSLISGTVNSALVTYQPEMKSGGATLWSVTPALPSGLSMDTSNGFITGRPTTAGSTKHTITASGYTGTAETEIRVIIASQPVSGLYAKYYKITDASFCSYKALSGNQIDLKFIKVDDDINHPAQNPVIPWTGLTNDFSTNFYVVWEGYLYHDTIGQWGFRITCDDGCKLLSTNNNELINNWSCHGYTGMETTRSISSSGYYYYKIEYQQSGGQGGMLFEWQKPNQLWTAVPAENMFHAPPSVVSYQYDMAHYFVNVEIEQNVPIFYGATGFSQFTVSPSLPTGLTLNPSSGIISGTPTTEINVAEYTISCVAAGVTEKTVISIDVVYVLPPSGLTLQQNGATVSNINAVAFVEIADITIAKADSSVEVTSYSISPDLPSGLSIDSTTGKISGTPTESLETTSFNVVAMNSGGSFFISFTLTVSGCKGISNNQEWTNYFYTMTLISGAGTIHIQDSQGSTIQCGKGTVQSNGYSTLETCSSTISAGNSFLICANPADAKKIYISCTESAGCEYQLSREDDVYYPYEFVYEALVSPPYSKTTSFPDDTLSLTSVEISTPQQVAYSGFEFTPIYLTPTGPYKTITVSPSLGDTISLIRPTISGSGFGTGVVTYTITVANDAQTVSTTFTIEYDICSEENGSAIYTFEVYTYAYYYEQSYEIYKDGDSTNPIAHVECPYSYTYYTNSFCLTSGKYNVKMMDGYGDGWSPDQQSYLMVRNSEGSVAKMMYFIYSGSGTADTVKWDYFTASIVDLTTFSWKMLMNSNPGRNWYKTEEDDSKWADVTSGVVGQWKDNTVYFRHSFDLDEDSYNYPVLQFSIYYRDGLVVYLNGEEVLRRNMPSSVSHSTTAISRHEDFYMRVGTAPGYILRQTHNVFAVEMHRHSQTTGDITWRAYVTPLEGTCITRIDRGTITESAFFNQATETAAAAWDADISTNWIENGLPAYTTFSYNFDRVEWVNKVILGSALRYPESDPTLITIYGSTDGSNWDTMKVIKQVGIWSSRGETKEFMMMDHLNAYGHYKVEITDTYNHVARTGLSVIDLLACQLVYCTKDGDWPGTLSGQTVTIDCPSGYLGERTRVCGNAELKPEWGASDETECRTLEPDKKHVFIDFAIAFTQVSVETMLTGSANDVRSVIGDKFDILLSTIDAWKAKDVTDNTVENPVMTTAVWIRITAATDDASTQLKAVTNGLAELTEGLRLFKSEVFTKDVELSFYMTPLLSERKASALSVGLIVILVILVVIIVAIVAFYIWVRTKSKKTKNGARQLRAAGVGQKVKAEHMTGKGEMI